MIATRRLLTDIVLSFDLAFAPAAAAAAAAFSLALGFRAISRLALLDRSQSRLRARRTLLMLLRAFLRPALGMLLPTRTTLFARALPILARRTRVTLFIRTAPPTPAAIAHVVAALLRVARSHFGRLGLGLRHAGEPAQDLVQD